jgi:predicted molibdopterin-dependent oxidoreductase YjgC
MRLLIKNDMVIGSLPDHANGTDLLCVKGRFGITEMVNHPTRLQYPTSIDREGNVPVVWEKAVEVAAEKISSCDPQKYGLIISADCSNETMYIAQKFVREVLHSKSIYLSSAAAYGRGLPIIERLFRASSPLSALSNADTILCMGFDGKYAQSVVETELHHAKRRGAKLITLDTQNHSLRRYADEWLQPAPGDEADLLEMLIEIMRSGAATPQLWPIPPQAQHSARLLRESKQTVVLVGPSFLTHHHNVTLLNTVEKLIAQIHARLVLLPGEVNLGGALQMGITNPLSTTTLQHLNVLHLVGEAIPEGLSAQPFVLFQNIFSSASTFSSGLVLPAAAFTEANGTFIDHAGELQHIHKAVSVPGSALPSWQILCLIAQKLGAPGFEYENEEQIQAEMKSMKRPDTEPDESLLKLFQPGSVVFPSSHTTDHGYMGFPLRTWVGGFQVLSPEPSLKTEE